MQIEAREDVDGRSVYVGNVDYGVTPEELQAHFQSCGTINRITILCDRATGQPKGFAYVEFSDKTSVANAVLLNGSMMHNRDLRVVPKRTNVPGLARGRGGPPRFGRGGSRGGSYGGYDSGYGQGYGPMRRGRGGFRGGRGRQQPY